VCVTKALWVIILLMKICRKGEKEEEKVLREGPRSQGASWAVCGSGVLPYEFLNLYGVFDCRFSASFS
jgi:hypothetical protein